MATLSAGLLCSRRDHEIIIFCALAPLFDNDGGARMFVSREIQSAIAAYHNPLRRESY